MKRFFVIAFLSIFLSTTTYALDWYVYKGVLGNHAYSVDFPSNWQVKTYGDLRQGFVNSTLSDDLLFSIDEFNGVNFDTAINYYVNSEFELLDVEDEIIRGKEEDFAAKLAYFKDLNLDETFSRIFIKRGAYIISLSNEENDTVYQIKESFKFLDNWSTLIDYKNNYSFNYPSFSSITKTDTKISLDTLDVYLKIFKEKTIDDVIDIYKSENRKLKYKEEIEFHNLENVFETQFLNLTSGTFTKVVLLNQDGKTFAIEIDDFDNYSEKYVDEILESFEFYDFEGDYIPYLHFPDVRDDHANMNAINYLRNEGVINGYEDGNFMPDGEINRAELTKMVIEAVTDVDKTKYNNCFPDVADEWYAGYVCFAKSKGWVSGYEDGDFKPGNMINRAEAMKIIVEVIVGSRQLNELEILSDKSVADISKDDWFYKYFTYINNRDLADTQHIEVLDNGKYNFKFTDNITRKEVAQIIYGLRDSL